MRGWQWYVVCMKAKGTWAGTHVFIWGSRISREAPRSYWDTENISNFITHTHRRHDTRKKKKIPKVMDLGGMSKEVCGSWAKVKGDETIDVMVYGCKLGIQSDNMAVMWLSLSVCAYEFRGISLKICKIILWRQLYSCVVSIITFTGGENKSFAIINFVCNNK